MEQKQESEKRMIDCPGNVIRLLPDGPPVGTGFCERMQDIRLFQLVAL
jgi:hypothetical protein